MTRIIADISVSLDGFVTGRDPSPDNGLGTDRLGARRRAGRRADAAPRAHRAGAGTALFTGGAPRTLVQRGVIPTSAATNLAYDVFR